MNTPSISIIVASCGRGSTVKMQHTTTHGSRGCTGDALEDMMAARHESRAVQRGSGEVARAWAKIKWREVPASGRGVEGKLDSPVDCPHPPDIEWASKHLLTAQGPNTKCIRGARGASFSEQLQREPWSLQADAWTSSPAPEPDVMEEALRPKATVTVLPNFAFEQLNIQHSAGAPGLCSIPQPRPAAC